MKNRAATRIWVFFYGSNINLDVLKAAGLEPAEWEVARAPGFDIYIAPTANLIHSDRHTVWGINVAATHAELAGLYTNYVQGTLGQTYLPEAILTVSADGKLRPAMTYISHDMVPGTADPAYLDRIVIPARQFGFPSWYLEKLEAYRA